MENEFALDQNPNEDDEFCVKCGRWIPGGCDLEFCDDITNCPYAPPEIDLNSVD